MSNCSIVPTTLENGGKSKVFNSALNFRGLITPEDFRALTSLNISNIRDLATYIFGVSQSLIDSNPTLVDTSSNEVPIDVTIKNIIENNKVSDVAKTVFQKILKEVTSTPDLVYNDSVSYTGEYSPTQQNYFNLVLGQAYLQVIKEFRDSGKTGASSLKLFVANQVRKNILAAKQANGALVDKVKDDFVASFYVELFKPNSTVWNRFISYLNNTYGTKFNSAKVILKFENDEFAVDSTEGIEDLWDPSSQERTNRINTVSYIVKQKLAEIFTDFNEVNSSNDFLYIQQPQDINTLWNRLISLHLNDITREDILQSLKGIVDQYPSVGKLIDLFEQALGENPNEDAVNLINAYTSNIRLAVIPANIIGLDKNFDIATYTNNNQAFPQDVISDRYVSIIESNISAKLYDANKLIEFGKKAKELRNPNSSLYTRVRNGESPSIMFAEFEEISDYLGLGIHDVVLERYLGSQNAKAEITLARIADNLYYVLQNVYSAVAKNEVFDNDSYNRIYNLAAIEAKDFNSPTSLSYLGVSGELRYSPQFDSFITKLLRGTIRNGRVNIPYLEQVFAPYLNDQRLVNPIASDPFLIYDEEIGVGLFEAKEVVKEGEFPYKLNLKAYNDLQHEVQLKLSQFEGLKLRDKGFAYRNLQASLYNFAELLYAFTGEHVILTSDSPRSYSISTRSIKTGDIVNNAGEVNVSSPIFKAISKIVKSEIYDFETAGRDIFVESNENLYKYHNKKYHNGKSFLDADGIPTGRSFKFLNITFNDNGVNVDFPSHVAGKLGISTKELYQCLVVQTVNGSYDGLGNRINLYDYVDNFVERYVRWNIDNVDSWFKSNITVLEAIIEKEKTHDSIAERYGIGENTEMPFLKQAMIGAVLNHTVYSVSFDNLISGNITEVKSQTDFNKRSNSPIKNGGNGVDTKSKRRIMIIKDGDFVTNMIDKFVDETGKDNSRIIDLNIIKAYKSKITYNDAQSIITDVALEEYYKATGRWDEMKPLFDRLRDTTKPFDPRVFNRLQESMKTHAYARMPRGEFHPSGANSYFESQVESIIIKDSAIVLFPSTAVGSLGDLYRWMTNPKVNIGQISPVSAVKVSGIEPFEMLDGDRELSLPTDFERHTITLRNSDFVIQQDVKPALVDEHIVIGNQFIKQITQGLENTKAIYNLHGKQYTGRELNQIFQETLATNIEEDAMQLLFELGGLNSDGTLNLDAQGNITLDYTKLVEQLQKVVEEDDASSNVREAISIDDKGMPRLALSYPIVYQKFESILLSKVSKKVISQKLLGFHVPIVSDTFNIPLGTNKLAKDIATAKKEGRDTTKLEAAYNAQIDKLAENGIVTYSDEFIERCKAEHRSLELRSEYQYDENGQLVHYAEVIANPFSLEFFNTIGVDRTVKYIDGNGIEQTKVFKSVDINAIPKEARQLIGIRIPTEGKQSMVLFEIVGFLNTGASQAIFPAQLIKRTGWDFDIDSIYAYRRNIFFDRGNYRVETFNVNGEAVSDQKGTKFKEVVLREAKRDFLASKDVQDPRINAIEGNRINGTLRTQEYNNVINGLWNLFNDKSTGSKQFLQTIQSLQNLADSTFEYAAGLSEDTFSKSDLVVLEQIRNYANGAIPNTLKSLKEKVQSYYQYVIEIYNAKKYAEAGLGRPLTEVETFNLTAKVGNSYGNKGAEFSKNTLIDISRNIQSLNRIVETIAVKIESLSEDAKTQLGTLPNGLSEAIDVLRQSNLEVSTKEGTSNVNMFKVNQHALDVANEYFRQYKKKFDFKEDKYSKNTREARENLIIDVAFSVLGNKEHAVQANKPNEADHINACAIRDNREWGISFDGLNAHNMRDKMTLATMSMGSTILKGHSVNFDGFMAIASNTHAYIQGGVKRVVNIEDLPIPKTKDGKEIKIFTPNGNITSAYAEFLNDRLGVGNWEYQQGLDRIMFKDIYFGNDHVDVKLDISGEDISAQQNETTTQILDSVKSPLMFLLNIDTLSVFRLLSAGTVIEKFYDPANVDNREPNRFSYASAFIQQPAVANVVEVLNSNLILDDNYNIQKAIKEVEKGYIKRLTKFFTESERETVKNTNQDVYESLFTDKSKPTENALKKAFKIIGNRDIVIGDELYTTRELVSFIQNRADRGLISTVQQYNVLQLFKEYYAQASQVSNLTFILKPEGKIDSFEKLDKEELTRSNYYISKEQFVKHLNEKIEDSKRSVERIANRKNIPVEEVQVDLRYMTSNEFQSKYEKYIVTDPEYKRLLDLFDRTRNVQERYDLVKTVLPGYETQFTIKTDIVRKGQSLVDAIFGDPNESIIDIDKAKFNSGKGKSVYPVIQARYRFGRYMARTMFNRVFAQRSDSVRNAVNYQLSKVGKAGDETLRKKLVGQIMNFALQSDVGGRTSLLQDVSESTLKIVIGTHGEDHTDIIKRFSDNIKDKLSDKDVADYMKLSIAEQLTVIHRNPTLSQYLNKPDFRGANLLKFIQYLSKDAYGNTKGLDIIRVIRDDDSSINTDSVVQSVKAMWESPNPFIAHTIRTLIAYTYITESFTFGTNISRYIPIDILTELSPNNVYDGYIRRLGHNDPTANISLYGSNLSQAEAALINDEYGDLDIALEYIGRQLPQINRSIPSATSQKRIFENDIAVATLGYFENSNGENVGSTTFMNADGKIIKCIFETEGRLRNSKYAIDNLVTETIDGQSVTYKRFEIPNQNEANPSNKVVVYLPVGKLLRNEFTERSLVDDYNVSLDVQMSDDTTMNVLEYLLYSPQFAAFKNAVSAKLNSNKYVETYEDEYAELIPSDNESINGDIPLFSIDDTFNTEDSYQSVNTNTENNNVVNIEFEAETLGKSLVESANNLSEKASTVVYIGSKPNMKYNTYTKHKDVIKVDYTKDPIKEANRIAKQVKDGILHIDGESLNDITINERNAYTWTNIFTNRLYELVNNVEFIQTLITNGFSKYVATSNVSDHVNAYTLEGNHDRLFSVDVNIQDSDSGRYNLKLFENTQIASKAIDAVSRIINASKYQPIQGIESIQFSFKNLLENGNIEDIKEALERKDTDTINVVFENLKETYSKILDASNAILNDLKAINLYGLENDYIKYQKYKEKLVLAQQLASTISKFDSIRAITMEEAGLDSELDDDVDIFEQQFGFLNEQLKELQSIYTASRETNVELTALGDKIIVNNIIKFSRNPKYATAFAKVLQRVRETSIDDIQSIDFGNLEVTDEERRDIFAKVFTIVNSDISGWQLWLDSAFVTGNTIVDVTGKSYMDAKYASEKQIRNITSRLEAALEKVDPKFAKDHNDRYISNYFKRFVNEYGDLIEVYRDTEIQEELSKLKEELYAIKYNMYDIQDQLSSNTISRVSTELDAVIDDFNKRALTSLEMISEDKQDVHTEAMRDMTAVEANNYMKQHNLVELPSVRNLTEGIVRNLYKIEFKDKAINPKFAHLSDVDKAFIQEVKNIIQEIMIAYNPNYTDGSSNIFPYVRSGRVRDSLLNFISIPKKRYDRTRTDIDGSTIYLIQPGTLNVPRTYKLFNIPQRLNGESYSSFNKRVMDEFEKFWDSDKYIYKGVNPPSNLKDLFKYNSDVKLENKKAVADIRSYNIKDVIKSFANDMFEVKTVRDYYMNYRLAMSSMERHGFDKQTPKLVRQFENQMKRVANVSKITNNLDVAASTILRYTSMTFMYGNVTAGIKNILSGVTQMITHSTPNGLFRQEDVRRGIGKMIHVSTAWIANLKGETTDNLDVAILKDFDTIYQDTRDVRLAMSGSGFISKTLSSIDTLGYGPNNIGEWIMQFGMLFACTKSFRNIGGRAMSFNQFYNENRQKLVSEVFTDDQKAAFYRWKERKDYEIKRYEAKHNKQYAWEEDYIGEFMRYNSELFTPEQRRKLREITKDNKATEKAKFESFPQLYDTFELKDGRLGFKDGYEMSDEYMTEFRETVKAINQSLHGIYNRVDRMALQDNVLGELFIQFKKWMRSTYVRMFGRRFGKSFFNETLGTWEVPTYKPFFDYLQYGYKKYKQERDGKIELSQVPKAILEIAKLQLKALANVRYFYNTLNIHEKAAVNRWVKYISWTFGVGMLTALLGSLKPDDKDDETFAYTLAMYELTSYFKELVEPVPIYGWASTVSQVKDRPFVSWQIMQNLYKVLQGYTIDLLKDDEKLIYQRGIYKGKYKRDVALEKLIPFVKEWNKWLHLKSSMQLYNYYNPFAL